MAEEATVTVFTREDCHLCEQAIETIRAVDESIDTNVSLELVDVDEDQELRTEYGNRVPYVFVDGQPAFKFRVESAELRRRLTG